MTEPLATFSAPVTSASPLGLSLIAGSQRLPRWTVEQRLSFHQNEVSQLRLTLLIPAKSASDLIESTISKAVEFLRSRFLAQFEVIVIPTPTPGDSTLELAEKVAARYPNEVRVVPHRGPVGKGAALRTGVEVSRGRTLFFTDADLPYDLTFIEQALPLLETVNCDLVTGNRRRSDSRFLIPVEWLRLAYGRHRLGLLFNRAVRLLFGSVRTRDTQAGIKGISRRLALATFSKSICPGFFFDLELFLTADAAGWKQQELPVVLHLHSEKSTVRLIREALLAVFWLARIRLRAWRGYYRALPSPLHRFSDTPLGTKIFLQLRWMLTPYSAMAAQLPDQGSILDLGCGHGLLSLALAEANPQQRILALDHDASRVTQGKLASNTLPHLEWRVGSVLEPLSPNSTLRFNGVTLIDVMHYFPATDQKRILEQAATLLETGGTLLVREVDPSREGWVARWNQLYEKIATSVGFTRSEQKADLHFRTPAEWRRLLESLGFEVQITPCSSRLFADLLFICRKKPLSARAVPSAEAARLS
jgi:dolichyl-phosphate beta-glucosyltransferase